MNPEDVRRDAILRFLYTRHSSAKSPKSIPLGIKDLQKAMKELAGMKQQEVSANLDYMVQAGWVREVTIPRTYQTAGGTRRSEDQIKYKISDVGINHLEKATVFKPGTHSRVNITNVQGVVVLGDGNIVNANFTDLFRALDQLDEVIAKSPEMTDGQKLEATGDLTTLRAQLAKPEPNHKIIGLAWEGIHRLGSLASIASVVAQVAPLIGPLLS